MKTTLIAALMIVTQMAWAQNKPTPAAPPATVPHQPTEEEKLGSSMDGAIKNAKVQITEPKNNAKVGKTFKVKMSVEGLKVRPAGEAPDEMTTGHHHILVDMGPIEAGMPIPNDDKHLHFGKGQTETEVTLPPGKHTLTLQFADGAHRSFGPKMSQTITVTVK